MEKLKSLVVICPTLTLFMGRSLYYCFTLSRYLNSYHDSIPETADPVKAHQEGSLHQLLPVS